MARSIFVDTPTIRLLRRRNRQGRWTYTLLTRG